MNRSKQTKCFTLAAFILFFVVLIYRKDYRYFLFQEKTCNISRNFGQPYEYENELDLRIIVLTYNRPRSLELCLKHVSHLDTLGDAVGVDIWIDRSKEGMVNFDVVYEAQMFLMSWKYGPANIHIWDYNVLIIGQWINTWRPKSDTKEMALILEDDIDISPQAYRWLKVMKEHFQGSPEIAGYCLQMENRNFITIGKEGPIRAPKEHSVYLYRQFCTWGYSPEPNFWRKFQDWFHEVSLNNTFHPYVPDIVSTKWYKRYERECSQESMWSMWYTYFGYVHNMYHVSSNLEVFANRSDVLLDTNRREKGLHFDGKKLATNEHLLLKTWDEMYERIPQKVIKYGYDGRMID